MSFTCPVCGSHEWGSAYNFDGPGDEPADSLEGARFSSSKTKDSSFGGTWTRCCHGYVVGTDGYTRSCRYMWNSVDDAANGIEAPPQGVFTGQVRT